MLGRVVWLLPQRTGAGAIVRRAAPLLNFRWGYYESSQSKPASIGDQCRVRTYAVCDVRGPGPGRSRRGPGPQAYGHHLNQHLRGLWSGGNGMSWSNFWSGLHLHHFQFHRKWKVRAWRAVYYIRHHDDIVRTQRRRLHIPERCRRRFRKPVRRLCTRFPDRAHGVRERHHRPKRYGILMLHVEFL
jgi:hypothetical protein